MSLTSRVPASVAADERDQPRLGEATDGRDSYLVVRVGREQFGLPLDSVAEALDSPVVLEVAGVDGRPARYVEWRGRRLPLEGARVPFGIESDLPSAVVLILADPVQPLALAVDEVCDVRQLPPSILRPFTGRADQHRVVRSVVVEDQEFIAILNPVALRTAILAEVPAVAPTSELLAAYGERVA